MMRRHLDSGKHLKTLDNNESEYNKLFNFYLSKIQQNDFLLKYLKNEKNRKFILY